MICSLMKFVIGYVPLQVADSIVFILLGPYSELAQIKLPRFFPSFFAIISYKSTESFKEIYAFNICTTWSFNYTKYLIWLGQEHRLHKEMFCESRLVFQHYSITGLPDIFWFLSGNSSITVKLPVMFNLKAVPNEMKTRPSWQAMLSVYTNSNKILALFVYVQILVYLTNFHYHYIVWAGAPCIILRTCPTVRSVQVCTYGAWCPRWRNASYPVKLLVSEMTLRGDKKALLVE